MNVVTMRWWTVVVSARPLCGREGRKAVDGLAGIGEPGRAGFGLGEGGGEPFDLLAQGDGVGCGPIVFALQQPQEFADVHAASSTSSRRAATGAVRRRSMPAVETR